VGTIVLTGSPDTTTGGQLQARLGDLTTPCPICKIPLPGRIVQGSMTVFVNKIPASRVGDLVLCGAGVPPIPPPGGFHLPASTYSVQDDDDYVKAVFTDDSSLVTEPPAKTAVDVPAKAPLSRFLSGLSLDLNLGMRIALTLMLAGPNAIQSGCSTVIIGG
jgi:uncharacterized Zn-binding protein involved in type VI secretion